MYIKRGRKRREESDLEINKQRRAKNDGGTGGLRSDKQGEDFHREGMEAGRIRERGRMQEGGDNRRCTNKRKGGG